MLACRRVGYKSGASVFLNNKILLWVLWNGGREAHEWCARRTGESVAGGSPVGGRRLATTSTPSHGLRPACRANRHSYRDWSGGGQRALALPTGCPHGPQPTSDEPCPQADATTRCRSRFPPSAPLPCCTMARTGPGQQGRAMPRNEDMPREVDLM